MVTRANGQGQERVGMAPQCPTLKQFKAMNATPCHIYPVKAMPLVHTTWRKSGALGGDDLNVPKGSLTSPMAAWKCFLGVLWHTRGISAQEPCAMKKYGHGVT